MTKIVLPHSGYKKLIVYKKSDVIYQGTVVFCRRFLPQYGDHTVDQMTQRIPRAKREPRRGRASTVPFISPSAWPSGWRELMAWRLR